MIKSVYIENVVYHSRQKEKNELDSGRIAVYNCTFEKTDYGSVIITRTLPINRTVKID